ncbi:MAG TPA: PilZ domain-containing protein [Nitrospira sp.]|nr:PilZ domain-containing protein [Nitrospira sp.]
MLEGCAGDGHFEGDILPRKGQIFDSALQEFQQAMRNPLQARKAFAELALSLKTLRRDEEAVTALHQALATGSFSFNERLCLLYLLAHTLESLNREFEALVIYRRIRSLHLDFYDVDSRIQELSSGKLHPPASLQLTPRRAAAVVKFWEHLKPQFASLLSQVWQTLAEGWNLEPTAKKECSTPTDQSVSARNNQSEKRRHVRVAIQLPSQFSSKAETTVASNGELRDLSPCGCRISSPAAVSLGTTLECWIYPQQGQPLAIEEATIQWVRHREFGLAFTKLRLPAKRQIADMCRKMAPL